MNDIISKPLLTNKETNFFLKLRKAFPEYYIFPQVSLNSLLTCSINNSWSNRAKFNRLVVDFVLYDSVKMKVDAILELDDWTHNYKEDQDRIRDEMLKAANYNIIRIASSEISIAELQALILR